MNVPSSGRMKVLVLDAQNQNTLAIVRTLGKQHEVHVGGGKKYSLSFYSKYSSKNIIIPDPKKYPKEFAEKLLSVIRNEKYDLVMPVGFRSYQLCAGIQDEIRKYSSLIVTTSSNIDLASDKNATYKLAEEIGIPFPKTYNIKHPSEFDSPEMKFPVVIKFPFESGKNIVEYAESATEAKTIFSEMIAKNNISDSVFPIVQELVRGDGYGFFACYENGVCKSIFMHHRLREYPVTGGASVCAESFYDVELGRLGRKILDHLKWDGVAMVEFKKDNSDGKYKLMEINPKFWGSLELAIVSGVNFPEMLLKRAAGKTNEVVTTFKNETFQWLLNGELFHFLSRPNSFFAIIETMSKSKKDFRLSDIKPNIFQVLNIFVHYYKKLRED